MSAILTIDTLLLFILVLTLIMDLVSIREPIMSVFTIGISALVLIPNIQSLFASSDMLGSFTVIVVLLSCVCAIVGVMERK